MRGATCDTKWCHKVREAKSGLVNLKPERCRRDCFGFIWLCSLLTFLKLSHHFLLKWRTDSSNPSRPAHYRNGVYIFQRVSNYLGKHNAMATNQNHKNQSSLNRIWTVVLVAEVSVQPHICFYLHLYPCPCPWFPNTQLMSFEMIFSQPFSPLTEKPEFAAENKSEISKRFPRGWAGQSRQRIGSLQQQAVHGDIFWWMESPKGITVWDKHIQMVPVYWSETCPVDATNNFQHCFLFFFFLA